MKAFKIVLVAALVSFTMMGMAQNPNRDHVKFDQKMIPLSTIDMRSDMGYAILTQVDAKTLLANTEHRGVYIAKVRLNGKIYEIFGTYKAWYRFLKINPRPLPFEKAKKEIMKHE